ncbi:MAG: hypothetical protein ACNS62_02650 [Candidatus Cyclobacteriaceae bacterium M3_2C_046]
MKNFNKSFILIVWIGVSCASMNKEDNYLAEDTVQARKITSAAIESQFISNHLTSKNLDAFELRAIQKLEDFNDYLAILTHPQYDQELKLNAMQQASSLFLHPGIDVNFSGISSLEHFLKTTLEHSSETPLLDISEIKVKEKLTPHSDLTYQGLITFRENQQDKTARMILKKTPKQFGQENLQVWEIFLGEIN